MSKVDYKNIIIQRSEESKHCNFNKIEPSVLTAQGKLTEVNFNEEDLILAINPTGRIKKLTSNFGELTNSNYIFPEPAKRKSNRGRKPKIKKKNIRRNQGSGKYFNSQITFWVISKTINDKFYKVKLFRNGSVEIPGGLLPDMSDIIEAVEIVAKAVGNCLLTNVEVSKLYSVMRNYKTTVMGDNIRLNIGELYQILVEDTKSKSPDVDNVIEVRYNPERYPGLTIKLLTPIPTNSNKRTTIKIFKSGKINIDGATSPECAEKYYYWLNWYFDKHHKRVLYTYKTYESESDSDSSSNSEDT